MIGTFEGDYGKGTVLDSLVRWGQAERPFVVDYEKLTWGSMFNPLKAFFSKESDERDKFIKNKIAEGAKSEAAGDKTLVFNWGNIGKIEKSSTHIELFRPLFNGNSMMR